MGLDAHVACNCFRDGLCTEPPVPRTMLTINECGDVELIDEQNCDVDVANDVYDWTIHACAHEDMVLVSEWVGNISGVAWLRSVVLAVVEDDDVGVIGVDDDALMRTPRSTVASGAFVISVTGSSSR